MIASWTQRSITGSVKLPVSSADSRLESSEIMTSKCTQRSKCTRTAICLSTLLYGSESWTLYAHQMKSLQAWNLKSLRCILITWRAKITHEDLFRRIGCTSLESQLGRRQLCWLGPVVRMEEERLPKQILYGELAAGNRSVGGQ